MTIIIWQEHDGRHISYCTPAQAGVVLEMIETDPSMDLLQVVER